MMITYMFPGQGAQIKGMGARLFKKFPYLVKLADEILDYPIAQLCVGDKQNQLDQTEYTQPALYVTHALAYLERYYETAMLPNFLIGHSVGEYVALFAAEVFDFATGVQLVKKRGELMAEAKSGGMAAIIGLDIHSITTLMSEHSIQGIEIANDNSPQQVVISGDIQQLKYVAKIFEQAGADLYSILNVSGAFHSSYMKHAADNFSTFLQRFKFNKPKIPIIANINALPYALQNEEIINNLSQQIAGQVRWTKSIHCLLKEGVDEFIEISEGKKILTRLVGDIKKHLNQG